MTKKKRWGAKGAGRAVREARGALDLRVQRRTAELEKANAELRKVEEHLRLALLVGGMVTWEIDPATGSIQYSDYPPRIVRGGSVTRYYSRVTVLREIHPEDRERLSQALDRLFTHIPRLRAAIPNAVSFIAPEDAEELIQDGTAMAARMMHNAEESGKRVVKSPTGRGKEITAGNVTYYTIEKLRSGRR